MLVRALRELRFLSTEGSTDGKVVTVIPAGTIMRTCEPTGGHVGLLWNAHKKRRGRKALAATFDGEARFLSRTDVETVRGKVPQDQIAR